MKRPASQQYLQLERRRGVISMELVLTLPILFILLLGLFEFMMLFYSRSLLVEASRAGARKASLATSTAADVEAEICRVLVPRLQQGMQVNVNFGEWSGDLVSVSVAVPMSNASPDLLWPVGFGLTGQNLFSETRMVRE
jgi:hypothetical protein